MTRRSKPSRSAPLFDKHVTAPQLAAIAVTRFSRSQTAEPGARRGPLARWSDGVATSQAQRTAFARYWHDRNR